MGFLSRLMGGADSGASQVDAAAQAQQQARQAERISHEIDAAYYRWLTGTARYEAPAEVQTTILDQVRGLTARPEEAAGLVPRVPEVIPQLLNSLAEEDVSASELSRLVVQDVVLTAEVIREANSAYYRPMTQVKTVEAAIMMLGQNGLRMLLARVAFRPIIKMQGDGFSRRAAPHVWGQSERCALAASLVAPGLTADVFEAYLAGLMQNVGLIVAFRLADGVCPNATIPGGDDFARELLACGRQLSAGIARHWEFPQEVTEAIAHAGDPGDLYLAQALSLGDRIAKLRLLIDAAVVAEDDDLVTEGLDSFQRRCLGKLSHLEA
ncbi:HDOD domain-containing protein [Massilia pinisoli]|uniref:HDOD domain-containing protein n=1 Tax=Massilia pinisoli TaxID=1772194 RepID=A0ABT1ZLG5_9BURK|nr:HDOD domain-containing protein [Massilia pinisoli]MCS0580747.1 HDOD domain-containing protein [Massilia pinisoli]